MVRESIYRKGRDSESPRDCFMQDGCIENYHVKNNVVYACNICYTLRIVDYNSDRPSFEVSCDC